MKCTKCGERFSFWRLYWLLPPTCSKCAQAAKRNEDIQERIRTEFNKPLQNQSVEFAAEACEVGDEATLLAIAKRALEWGRCLVQEPHGRVRFLAHSYSLNEQSKPVSRIYEILASCQRPVVIPALALLYKHSDQQFNVFEKAYSQLVVLVQRHAREMHLRDLRAIVALPDRDCLTIDPGYSDALWEQDYVDIKYYQKWVRFDASDLRALAERELSRRGKPIKKGRTL